MRNLKRIGSIAAAGALVGILLTACGADPAGEQPAAKSADVLAAEITPKAADQPFCEAQTAFAAELLRRVQTGFDGENIMVSPYSVVQALAMAANGAAGDTRTEMEQLLGGKIPLDVLDQYLYAWRTEQPDTKTCKLKTANAIWIKDSDFEVNPDFLTVNREWFGAECRKAPFNTDTVSYINRWVSDKTDDMIPKIIDNLTPDMRSVLVNAVCFDAKWQTPYESEDIKSAKFRNADGSETETEMMYSDETAYLEQNGAVGFLRYYDGPYAFAGILPPEDLTVEEYLAQLDGEQLGRLLTDVQETEVRAGMPAFSGDTTVELKGILSEMGMPAAFTEQADFSGISGTNPVRIGEVIHKTHIDVDANGTKAAAATAVTFQANGILVSDQKIVILNRPFVYAIVDLNTHLPVFIGTVQHLAAE